LTIYLQGGSLNENIKHEEGKEKEEEKRSLADEVFVRLARFPKRLVAQRS
jgi:hypothetical protein